MPSPLSYPLVCSPALLAEVERLAAQLPGLEYQHCIVIATAARDSARPTMTELAERRSEARRAHRRTSARGWRTGWDR